jgi:phenylalanyl-tRNA synthetase alpha chain
MTPEQIAAIAQEGVNTIEQATDEKRLRELEIQLLGKKGQITGLTRAISEAPPQERGAFGRAVNDAKKTVTQAIESRREALQNNALNAELTDFDFDVTLPGIPKSSGTRHPLTLVQEQVEEIFVSMGFYVLDYPEVEDDFHNFEALNIPKDHPARDMQDTFWLKNGQLLRTHTSPGQIRAMGEYAPPFRAIFPGKVFRYEAVDASHEHTFHQIEGLMIDRKVSVANLIGSMKVMLSQIFGREVLVRLRPGYFPFVEPGFELDMNCLLCSGNGCRVCSQSGWVEFLGCGLVHPNVLKAGGLDPEQWQGWAFGVGWSRLVMMRYGIDDIRHLMGGDIRFLKQFG